MFSQRNGSGQQGRTAIITLLLLMIIATFPEWHYSLRVEIGALPPILQVSKLRFTEVEQLAKGRLTVGLGLFHARPRGPDRMPLQLRCLGRGRSDVCV